MSSTSGPNSVSEGVESQVYSIKRDLLRRLRSAVIQRQEGFAFFQTLMQRYQALTRDARSVLRMNGTVGSDGFDYNSVQLRYVLVESGLLEALSVALDDFFADKQEAYRAQFYDTEQRDASAISCSFGLWKKGAGRKPKDIQMVEAGGIFDLKITVPDQGPPRVVMQKRHISGTATIPEVIHQRGQAVRATLEPKND